MMDSNIVSTPEPMQNVPSDLIPDELAFGNSDLGFEQQSSNAQQVPTDVEISQVQHDPEKLARLFQSRYDKTLAEYNKYKQQTATLEERAKLLDRAIRDKDFMRAVVHDTHPDLISMPSLDNFVESKLAQEFGADFTPDESIAKQKPWSKDAMYYERARSLVDEYKKFGESSGSVKQYIEQSKQEELAQQQQMEQIRTEIKTRFKASDQDITDWLGFMKNLTPSDYFKLFVFAKKYTQQRNNATPNIANYQGQGIQQATARDSFLAEFTKR